MNQSIRKFISTGFIACLWQKIPFLLNLLASLYCWLISPLCGNVGVGSYIKKSNKINIYTFGGASFTYPCRNRPAM
jgi:hypothetical protein